MVIEYECDPEKENLNKAKHGIDFDTAACIWEGPTVEAVDQRNYGETRMISYGAVEGRVIAVVYTWRGNVRRIISARGANRNERKNYYEAIERGAFEPRA